MHRGKKTIRLLKMLAKVLTMEERKQPLVCAVLMIQVVFKLISTNKKQKHTEWRILHRPYIIMWHNLHSREK